MDGGGVAAAQWRYAPYYGAHATAREAKAAWARANNPELEAAEDAFCAMHFDRWARNLGGVKTIRVTEEQAATLVG